MPTKVLLSTDAAVEVEVLPVAAKKRVKAGNAKPFIPEKKKINKEVKEEDGEDGEGGEGGGEGEEEEEGDRDDRDDRGVKRRKQKGPRPKGGLLLLIFYLYDLVIQICCNKIFIHIHILIDHLFFLSSLLFLCLLVLL